MNVPYKYGVEDSPLSNFTVGGSLTGAVIPQDYNQHEVFLAEEQLKPITNAGISGEPDTIPVEVKSPYKISIEG